MRSRRLNVIILSPTRGQIRQLRVTKAWLVVGLMAFVASFLLGAYGLYKQITIRKDRQRISALVRENRTQHEQIRSIATEMEALKQQLVRLHRMDRRIRIIANLDQGPSGVNLQGVGGVNPEEGVLQSLQRERKERWAGHIRDELGRIRSFAGQQEASFKSLVEQLREKQDLLAHTPSIWPTQGWLSCGFGYRQSPFTGLREFHRGVDVATRQGTPVITPADGVVVEIGKDRGFGRFIRLDHGFSYKTYYAHLSEVVVKKGQKVHRGQMIGKVGSTGRTTGPHLHYEIHVKGLPVNPLRYVLN